jgi:hypothetical protein
MVRFQPSWRLWHRLALVLGIGFALACPAGPVHAALIYTTGGNPPTFFNASGNNLTNNVGFAEPFTPSGNFVFNSFMAAFDFAAPASTNTIVLSLRMDNGCDEPGEFYVHACKHGRSVCY